MVIALSSGQTKQAFGISKCLFCLSSDILPKKQFPIIEIYLILGNWCGIIIIEVII